MQRVERPKNIAKVSETQGMVAMLARVRVDGVGSGARFFFPSNNRTHTEIQLVRASSIPPTVPFYLLRPSSPFPLPPICPRS